MSEVVPYFCGPANMSDVGAAAAHDVASRMGWGGYAVIYKPGSAALPASVLAVADESDAAREALTGPAPTMLVCPPEMADTLMAWAQRITSAGGVQ